MIIWVTCFSGDSGFKNCSCLRKSRLQVMMFVRIYTVLAVCVVVQGRAVFTAHVKNKCVMMMIDEEYTSCLRFPRKNGIHRSCSGKWNGLLVMILTCCERSKAHSRFTVAVMEKILSSEFLDSWKYLSTCRKTQLRRQMLKWRLLQFSVWAVECSRYNSNCGRMLQTHWKIVGKTCKLDVF